MEGRRHPNKYLDDRICEEFQNSLEPEKIEKIWRSFRETGNSTEGRIVKSVLYRLRQSFKKVFNKFGDRNEQFLDNLFDRFKLDKNLQGKSDKEQVDLQDLVIALAILARIPYEEKLKFIFMLTDVDEDGCLSIEQIYKMIVRIERNFCKENSYANVDRQLRWVNFSASLLYEISMRKAQRTYREIMQLLRGNNNEMKLDSNGLITCDEYIEALKKSEELFKNEKFLPATFPLNQILKNVPSELLLQITQPSKKDFCDFRKDVYTILKNGNQESNIVRYPGKVEIVKDQKVVETLPAVEKKEKNQDKKINQKPEQTKQKNPQPKVSRFLKQNSHQNEDRRDYAEQKNQQQTLEMYKGKVKKMRETKDDPRLNIRFDPLIRR